MSKLDDIIHSLWCRAVVTGFQIGKGVDKDEAGYKQQIKDLILELIGEDEQYGPKLYKPARNAFRAVLRQKVSEL